MARTNLDFSEFDALFTGNNTEEAPQANTQELANEKNVKVTPTKVINESIQITNVNAPINPSVLQSAQAKMQQISVEMNQLFVERDELIKLMMLAITTGTNLLMLGPPGSGKSAVTYELCGRIENAKYFQWMNTRTGEVIPNMPITSNLVIEDYTIDPRTHLAKNTNLNSIKKVVVINNGEFNNF